MITKNLLPEIQFRFVRSSGSGGQHVNKVATKVELYFDVEQSNNLSDIEKTILKEKLSTRINKDGVLQLSDQSTRSQLMNKEKAIQKFEQLIQTALKPAKKRKGPKKLKANRVERLKAKKKRSEQKKLRQKVTLMD